MRESDHEFSSDAFTLGKAEGRAALESRTTSSVPWIVELHQAHSARKTERRAWHRPAFGNVPRSSGVTEETAGRDHRRQPRHRPCHGFEARRRRRGGAHPLRRGLSRRAGGARHQPADLGLQGAHAQGRHGAAQRAGPSGGGRRQGDGRHRRHRRQCRHRRTRQAGRSRHRDLGPHLRRQSQGQLAAGQGGPSASQAVEGCGRHAGLDGRHHAADPDRRLQPGQGGPRSC